MQETLVWFLGQKDPWRRKWQPTPVFFFLINKIFIYFNWKLITLQYCNIAVVFAIHWQESATVVHVSPCLKPPFHLPPHSTPLGCPSAPALSALFRASNLDWPSISFMVIYMFQCYFLKSSHPHLLPLSPKACYLRLCPLCFPACRVVSTVFIDSMHMC